MVVPSELDATFFLQVVGLFLCLLGSSYFSASETALTAMTRFRVRHLLGGEPTDHPLERWLEETNAFLATILIGNTVINIFASLLGGWISVRLVTAIAPNAPEWVSGVVALIGMSAILLTFGEIIPKTFAKVRAERMSAKIAGQILMFSKLFRPISKLLLWVSHHVVRWFGGDMNAKEGPFVTEDTIRMMVEVGEREGVLEQDEREMIHSVIEFGDTIVREVMTPRTEIVFLFDDDPFDRVIQVSIEEGHSRIPVCHDNPDELLGILYVRDLIKVLHKGGKEKFNIEELVRPIQYVPETKPVRDLLREMQASKLHLAIVVDEYGGTSGLVTIEDLLEEIVGEIQDEFDEEEEDIQQVSESIYEVNGRVDLHDLIKVLGVDIEEADDFETLGGYVTSLFGNVPPAGERIANGRLKFEILDGDPRRVERVRIEVTAPTETEPTTRTDA